MNSQLTAMRERLAGRRKVRPGPANVVALASGRGGSGVSLLSAAIAVRSAQAGLRTLLVDADPWLDVQRVWFGVPPGPSLNDLGEGQPAEGLVQPVHGALELLSFGGAGVVSPQYRAFARRLPPLFEERDVVVIDAGSRLDAVDRALDLATGSIVAVSGADAIGLASTHALLKAVRERADFTPSVLFNQTDARASQRGADTLGAGARRFLGEAPEVLGAVPTESAFVGGLTDGAMLAERLVSSGLPNAVLPVMRRMRPWGAR